MRGHGHAPPYPEAVGPIAAARTGMGGAATAAAELPDPSKPGESEVGEEGSRQVRCEAALGRRTGPPRNEARGGGSLAVAFGHVAARRSLHLRS